MIEIKIFFIFSSAVVIWVYWSQYNSFGYIHAIWLHHIIIIFCSLHIMSHVMISYLLLVAGGIRGRDILILESIWLHKNLQTCMDEQNTGEHRKIYASWKCVRGMSDLHLCYANVHQKSLKTASRLCRRAQLNMGNNLLMTQLYAYLNNYDVAFWFLYIISWYYVFKLCKIILKHYTIWDYCHISKYI